MAKAVIKMRGVFAGRTRVWVGDAGPRTKVAQQVTDEIMAVAMKQPVANTMAEVYRTAKSIEAVVKRELRQMAKVIDELLHSDQLVSPTRMDTMEGPSQTVITANMLMSNLSNEGGAGYGSPSNLKDYGGTSGPPTGTVKWSYLSRGWLHEKKPRKHFFHGKTGQVRRTLRNMNTWAQNTLGGVKVTVRKGPRDGAFGEDSPERRGVNAKFRKTQGRTFLLAQMDIEIFGNLTNEMAPGLRARDWTKAGKSERLPGLNNIRHKLDGPKHRYNRNLSRRAAPNGSGFYRPLLTPIAQFWALHRLPQAIRWAAEQPLTRQRARLKGDLATLKSGRS
jgi:hypothetical protein